MSRTNWEMQELIDAASRFEALPSHQRLAGVRAAVLRRALVGGAVTIAGSTTFWAKAAALGASTVSHVAMFAAVGAVAGGVVVGVAAHQPKAGGSEPIRVERSVPSRSPSRLAEPLPGPTVAASPIIAVPTTTDEPSSPLPPPRAAPVAPAREPAPSDVPRSLEVASQGAVKTADTLPQQLDVLRKMHDDLAGRRASQVLSLYRENESLFRGASLEPEARGASIAALCQLGRDDDARREAARLLASFPSSHLAQRLAAGCSGASNP